MKQRDWLSKFTKKASIVSDFATFRNFIYYKTSRDTTSFIPKNYVSNFSIIPRWNFDVREIFSAWGNNTALAATYCYAYAGQATFCFSFLT